MPVTWLVLAPSGGAELTPLPGLFCEGVRQPLKTKKTEIQKVRADAAGCAPLASKSGYRTPLLALRRGPGNHAPRGSFLSPTLPADPPGVAWREAVAARGARAAPAAVAPGAGSRPRGKLSAGPAQDRAPAGDLRLHAGPARDGGGATAPGAPGAGRVPGWEPGKPCSGTEPRLGAEEGGESPLFFLGAEYCANSGNWDFSPPAPVQRGEGLEGRRGERRLTKRGTLRGGRKPAGA